MFSNELMSALIILKPEGNSYNDLDSIAYSCDCTGGCTDNCYDCSSNSNNQW